MTALTKLFRTTTFRLSLTYLALFGAAAALAIIYIYWNTTVLLTRQLQDTIDAELKGLAEQYTAGGLTRLVRTVADLANDTTLRLAQVPNIVGIKDATGNMERGTDLAKRAPPGFALYSGDDASGLALMLMGGHGVISVTANVAPRLMREMCAAALADEVVRAREANFRLLGLHKHLFVEANPIPVKWAVAQLGLIEGGIRLPLTPLAAQHHDTVREAMREAGVLQQASGLRLVEGRGA